MKQKNPIGNLRQKQKAETYRLILKTARNLFERLGFEKTTMRKVAAAAGISPGAIFKHFEHKDALLAAALFNDIDAVQEKALARIPKGGTFQDQFLYIAEKFFRYYAIRPVLSKILVKHSLFIEGEWAEKFNCQTNRLLEKTIELIQAAQRRKEIRKDIDPKTLAAAIFSHYLLILIIGVKEPVLDITTALVQLRAIIEQTIRGAL